MRCTRTKAVPSWYLGSCSCFNKSPVVGYNYRVVKGFQGEGVPQSSPMFPKVPQSSLGINKWQSNLSTLMRVDQFWLIWHHHKITWFSLTHIVSKKTSAKRRIDTEAILSFQTSTLMDDMIMKTYGNLPTLCDFEAQYWPVYGQWKSMQQP